MAEHSFWRAGNRHKSIASLYRVAHQMSLVGFVVVLTSCTLFGTGGGSSTGTAPTTSNSSKWTWTDQTAAGLHDWWSITSSSDGTHLAAVVYGGDIYASSDSGATWSDETTTVWTPSNSWISIASSADGTHLSAAENGGDVFTGVYK